MNNKKRKPKKKLRRLCTFLCQKQRCTLLVRPGVVGKTPLTKDVKKILIHHLWVNSGLRIYTLPSQGCSVPSRRPRTLLYGFAFLIMILIHSKCCVNRCAGGLDAITVSLDVGPREERVLPDWRGDLSR